MPALKLKYSLTWANSVVGQLHQKYTRATETVCELLGINLHYLAVFLAIGDNVFPQIRGLIHQVHAWHALGVLDLKTPTYVKCLVHLLYKKGFERLADRLDSQLEKLTLKEQAFKGGFSEEGDSRPRKPSTSPDDLPGQGVFNFEAN